MTQEDKELLLKDLFARLPYNVKIQYKNNICTINTYTEYDKFLLIDKNKNEFPSINDDNLFLGVEEIKPYLFPLSSMSKEQTKELCDILMAAEMENLEDSRNGFTLKSAKVAQIEIDFYNKNHFDYRGLIEKGLAIDCTNLNIY